MAPCSGKQEPSSNMPVFKIDLSLPPRERYVALATHYKPLVQTLIPLFNSLLSDLAIPPTYHVWINRVARLLLRRVYSSTETQELQGIADATGVEMYLLVSLNVVLDLLMGCTSGAAQSREASASVSDSAMDDGEGNGGSRMLHFRTLDWSMDPLRRIIVQLDFIDSRSITPEKVVASSITYVGFVGVLTGVRPGLSMSLNFRAVHDARRKREHFRFYAHHLLVLLGLKPSISSLLRKELLPEADRPRHSSRGNSTRTERESSEPQAKTLDDVAHSITKNHTTAAYLIFCNGDEALTIEKDYATARIRRSRSFIVTTNHDQDNHEVYHSPASFTNSRADADKSTRAHAKASSHSSSFDGSTDEKSQAPVPAVQAGIATIPTLPSSASEARSQSQPQSQTARAAGLEDLLAESADRLQCIERKWARKKRHLLKERRRQEREQNRERDGGTSAMAENERENREVGTVNPAGRTTRSQTQARARNMNLTSTAQITTPSSSSSSLPLSSTSSLTLSSSISITTDLDELTKWVKSYPTTNETTHFSCILDPHYATSAELGSASGAGRVLWSHVYTEPLNEY